MALQKESQPRVKEVEFEDSVRACVSACESVCVSRAAAAGSDFKLTMWNQGFPFLTTSNIKATCFCCHLMMCFYLFPPGPYYGFAWLKQTSAVLHNFYRHTL